MEVQKNTPPPDPSKFEIYEEVEDKSGFTTPDGNFYKYDVYGGWYDEYQNYYNCDCEPCDPPQNDDFLDNDNNDQYYANDDDEYDDKQMTDVELKLVRETRIEVLNEILDKYDENFRVQILYSNMFTWAVENDIKKWLTDSEDLKDIPIVSINICRDENGKITGKGDFMVENLYDAKLIIEKKTHTFFEFKTEKKTLKQLIYLNLQDDLDEDENDEDKYQDYKENQQEDHAEQSQFKQQEEEQKQEPYTKLSQDQIDDIFSEQANYQILIHLTPKYNKKYYEQLLEDNFNDNDFYNKKIILQNINDQIYITKKTEKTTTKDLKQVYIFLNKKEIPSQVQKSK